MSDKRVCAIHQPNFFPWLGYFDKIARSDVFILLDDIQFPKKGGTWTNRVPLLIGGKPNWFTVPVVRSYHGVLPITEMKINNAFDWRNKLLKTIETNYRRSPFYTPVFPLIADLLDYRTDYLADFNKHTLFRILETLKLRYSHIVCSSELKVEANSTDRLILLAKAVSATTYMSGGGAAQYQEDWKFHASGIDLFYQNFEHPVYPQFNKTDFLKGLSIIDVLMNTGFAGTADLIVPGMKRMLSAEEQA